MFGNSLDILQKRVVVKVGLFNKNGTVNEIDSYYEGKKGTIIGKYTGQIKNGFPNGKGKLFYTGLNGYILYEGEWDTGLFSGVGEIAMFPFEIKSEFEFSSYSGQITLGVITGFGKMIYDNFLGKRGYDFYEGEFKEFKRVGKGLLRYKDDNERKRVSFEGTWVNDLPKHGVLIWKDGSKYEGDLLNDKKNGSGVFFHSNGTKYDGNWQDGKLNGDGIYYNKNGEIAYKGTYVNGFLDSGNGIGYLTNGNHWIGEWLEGNPYGKGTLYDTQGKTLFVGDFLNGKYITGNGIFNYDNGEIYEGDWKDGLINGEGTYIWPSGRKYVGQWKDGLKNGEGIYTWPDGTKYEGHWKDDKRNGQGIMIESDGTKYIGNWQDNLKSGDGAFTWPDGKKYEGQWKDDKINGQGIMIGLDGTKYDGNWQDGLKSGEGTFTWPDGKKYVGQWKDDKKHGTGTLIEADGAISLNGEWEDDCFTGSFTGQLNYGSDIYTGQIKFKEREGKGIMTYADRPDGLLKFEGEWEEDKPVKGVFSFTGGGAISGQFSGDHLYSYGTGIIDLFDGIKFEGTWAGLFLELTDETEENFLVPVFQESFVAKSYENDTFTGEHLFLTEVNQYPYKFNRLDDEITHLIKEGQFEDAQCKIDEIRNLYFKDKSANDPRSNFLSEIETQLKKLKADKLQEDILSKFGGVTKQSEENSTSETHDFDDFA